MVQFRSKNELINFLKKGLEIEKGFESLAQWEAYVQAKNDNFRNTIFTMISDSEQHASMVEDMLQRLGADTAEQYGLRKQNFNFSNKEESEIVSELAKTEKLAFDTYSNIKSGLIGADLTSWISEDDRRFIIERMDILINEERCHFELASKLCGRVERIR